MVTDLKPHSLNRNIFITNTNNSCDQKMFPGYQRLLATGIYCVTYFIFHKLEYGFANTIFTDCVPTDQLW